MQAWDRIVWKIVRGSITSTLGSKLGGCCAEKGLDRNRTGSANDYLLQHKTLMIFWRAVGCVSAFCGLDPC